MRETVDPMADEPDNLVLVQLRDIRGILELHTKRFNKLEERFDNSDKQFEEMRGYIRHTLGLGSMNHITNERQDARLDAQDGERKKLAEQVAGLDKRVGKIEERLDR